MARAADNEPVRYVYYIDVGSISPDRAHEFLKRVKAALKKRKKSDGA